MVIKNKKFILLLIALLLIVAGSFYYYRTKHTSIRNFEPFFMNLLFHDGDIEDDEQDLKNVLASGVYSGHLYHLLFSDLYSIANGDKYRDDWLLSDCIKNKAEPACTFYNAIINNDESLCDQFPYAATLEDRGKYGTNHYKIYYRMTCKLNARMLAQYDQAPNKLDFCSTAVGRDKWCIMYVCQNHYWKKEQIPDWCEEYMYGPLSTQKEPPFTN